MIQIYLLIVLRVKENSLFAWKIKIEQGYELKYYNIALKNAQINNKLIKTLTPV